MEVIDQTKRGSAIETVLNVGSGYFISLALNIYFLPYFVDGISQQDLFIAIFIGLVYTGTSMARSFTFRRIFNKFLLRKYT